MPTIQAGVSDSRNYFNLNGIDYPVGNYTLYYGNRLVDSNGDIDESVLETGIRHRFYQYEVPQDPVPLSSWEDSAGDPFPDLSTFLETLGELLGFNAASGGSGAVVPRSEHIFTSVAARDTYFTANPDDLEPGLPIFVTVGGNLIVFSDNARFFDYQDIEIIDTTVVTLENESNQPNFGLLTTQYTENSTLELDVSLQVPRLNVSNIPASAAGLSSGDIWNDSGTLRIVT